MYLLYKSIEILATIMPFLLFSFLTDSVFLKSERYKKSIFLIFGILYFTVVFAGETYFHNLLISIFGMLICIGMVWIQFDIGIHENIITVILFNVIDILVTNLVITLFGLTGIYNIEQLFTEGKPERALYVLAISAIQTVQIYYLTLFFRKESIIYRKTLFLSVLFFIPDFFVVLFLHIILAYYKTENQIFYLICLILAFFTFFASFFGLYLLNLQQRKQEDTLRQSVMDMQLKEQEIQIQENEERFERFQIYRHDMKHLLLNYKFLLEEGKTDEVRRDIETILTETMGVLDHPFTDHNQLNALIHSKYRHCLNHSIEFQCSIRLSPLFYDMDLMILLANLFDNAIEAERKEPKEKRLIRFELIDHQDYLSLVLQNYISDSVLTNNPKLKTSKTDSNIHGIGMRSIRSILKKKDGMMELYEEDHLFCVHIIYQIM